jgi:citrate synthase
MPGKSSSAATWTCTEARSLADRGWTAHVLEQLSNNKLIRPESDYTGPRDVPYVPIDARG